MTSPHRLPSLLAVSALAALAGFAFPACSGDDSPLPAVGATQAPLARLWLPVYGAPATSLVFDASDSQSPGGEVAHYHFDFGDGSAALDQGSPLASHTYVAEGTFAVSLAVTDLEGKSAQVATTVTVRADPPACSASSDCRNGERCNLICFAEVGSPVSAARATR